MRSSIRSRRNQTVIFVLFARVSLVRFRIDNADLKIRPGMMAYVHLGRESRQAAVVPKGALVRWTMPLGWVKTAPGMFERRMVRTG